MACGLNGSTGYFHPRAADAASPFRLSRSHSRITETSRPRAANSAAATKPSPPLLPGPATTTIGALLHQLHRGLGDGLACAEHQREAGSPRGNREPVGPAHFIRGENFHAKFLVRAPYPEAFPQAVAGNTLDDCMPIDPIAYFVGLGMVSLSTQASSECPLKG